MAKYADSEKLSQKDVDLLFSNPSTEEREQTARSVSEQYAFQDLNDEEKVIAEDIFRLIMNDREISVREKLSESLRHANELPPDIAGEIISDVASVAVPMLRNFEGLSDAELIRILSSDQADKQTAIACRRQVSETVCQALVQKAKTESPIIALLDNRGSMIAPETYHVIFDRFGQSQAVQRPLFMRPDLPPQMMAQAVPKISADVQRQLLGRSDLSVGLTTELVTKSREVETATLSETSTEEDVRNLVVLLNGLDRLTPNLILRSVCAGDMKFFEYAMAVKASVPIRNARILIYESGAMGLERIFEETKLPAALLKPIQLAVRIFTEMLLETEDGHRDNFGRRMMERLLMLFDENNIKLDESDANYFMQKIGQAPEAESES